MSELTAEELIARIDLVLVNIAEHPYLDELSPSLLSVLLSEVKSRLSANGEVRNAAIEEAAQVVDARLLHGVSERIRALKSPPQAEKGEAT